MAVTFDWEQLGSCKYGVYQGMDVFGCGEPATHRVWWKDDKSDAMLVCKEHFMFMVKTEKEATDEYVELPDETKLGQMITGLLFGYEVAQLEGETRSLPDYMAAKLIEALKGT